MSFFGAKRPAAAQSRGALLLLVLACVLGGFFVWGAVKESPARAHVARGIELMQNGRDTDAEAQWREAVRLDSGNARAWSLLGDFYLRARDYKMARAALEHAVQTDPTSSETRLQLAASAFALHDNATAHREALAVLKQEPQNIGALQLLAQIEDQTGDKAARLAHLQRLVELQPDDARALTDLVNERGARKEYDQAIPLAERLVKLSPDSASAYFLRGLALYSATPDDAALTLARDDFEKSLRLQPGNIEAHRYLARTYMLLGQPRPAIAQWEAVGRGRPYALAHLLEMSNAYRRAGDSARAAQIAARFASVKALSLSEVELDKTIGRQPKNVEPLLQMAALLTRAVQGDDGLFQLYRFRYLNGEWKSVGAYVDKARQIAPTNAKVRAASGDLDALTARLTRESEAALRRGDIQIAKARLARAILLRPHDPKMRAAFDKFAARGIDAMGTLSAAQIAQATG